MNPPAWVRFPVGPIPYSESIADDIPEDISHNQSTSDNNRLNQSFEDSSTYNNSTTNFGTRCMHDLELWAQFQNAHLKKERDNSINSSLLKKLKAELNDDIQENVHGSHHKNIKTYRNIIILADFIKKHRLISENPRDNTLLKNTMLYMIIKSDYIQLLPYEKKADIPLYIDTLVSLLEFMINLGELDKYIECLKNIPSKATTTTLTIIDLINRLERFKEENKNEMVDVLQKNASMCGFVTGRVSELKSKLQSNLENKIRELEKACFSCLKQIILCTKEEEESILRNKVTMIFKIIECQVEILLKCSDICHKFKFEATFLKANFREKNHYLSQEASIAHFLPAAYIFNNSQLNLMINNYIFEAISPTNFNPNPNPNPSPREQIRALCHKVWSWARPGMYRNDWHACQMVWLFVCRKVDVHARFSVNFNKMMELKDKINDKFYTSIQVGSQEVILKTLIELTK